MKTMIALLLLLVGIQAQAWDNKQNQNQHQTQTTTVNSGNTTTNSHNNTSTSGASSAATGGSSESSGTLSSQVASNYINSVPRQAPPAIGTTTFQSNDCTKTYGAGASAPFGGISLGGGKVDKNCRMLRTADDFANQGKMLAYCKIMVMTQDAKAAGVTMDDCMYQAPEPTPIVEPVAPEPIAPPILLAEAPIITINVPAMPVLACPRPIHKHRASKPCPTLEK
jgi:hypothetical protein